MTKLMNLKCKVVNLFTFLALMTKCRKEKINNNVKYFFATKMINKPQEIGNLSSGVN